jgi:hypothetical protein
MLNKIMTIFLSLVVITVVSSCKKNTPTQAPANPHVTNAVCGNCHTTEQSEWASSADLHAASAADILTNVPHNTAELLNDDCLKCHSSFQYPLGVAHFVTPVDQVGNPAGTWTVQNMGDWKATKCEVCHDPSGTDSLRLAKYGSVLDGQWSAGYTQVLDLPAAYQKIINITNGDTSTFIYPNQTTVSVKATKLCNSCHDPADQGSDPAIVVNGIDFGPQGGDSRSYVALNHQGFGCTDCHAVHDFMPVTPETTPACKGCHSLNLTGKVHMNHW